jgi:hypothetical protein
VPPPRGASSFTTLGPLAEEPFDNESVIDEHFVNERLAEAEPAPTAMLKVRVGLPGLSEPENVTVCAVGLGLGAGAGAPATTAVGAETDVAEPPALLAVTETRSVVPTSTDWSTYYDEPAPPTVAHAAPALSQRCHAYE